MSPSSPPKTVSDALSQSSQEPEAVYLSLGSNESVEGNRLYWLDLAITALAAHPDIEITAQSSWYETEPWGFREQAWFINGVIALKTTLSPQALFGICQDLEHQAGRQHRPGPPGASMPGGMTSPIHQAAHQQPSHVRWGPRTLDLDMLSFGTRISEDLRLTLPHPRIPQRRFVLIPLCEIAPHWKHPADGRSAEQLLEAIDSGRNPHQLQVKPLHRKYQLNQ